MLKRLFRWARKDDPGPGPVHRPTETQEAAAPSVVAPPEEATPPDAAASSPPAAGAATQAVPQAPPSPSLADRIRDLEDRFADEVNDVALILEKIQGMSADLPQPPLAAQAVLRVLNRQDYELDELVVHLEKDPAICQTLLRHANSPWYGGSSEQPIVAIRPAVQRVGGNGVHAAVMQHFVSGELLRPGPKFEDMARKVWQHMVRTAPVARDLARIFGVDPDRAYTMALLHDVGKLAFLDQVGRERKRLRREVGISPGFVSVALTELHEPLGREAALAWGLPGTFADAIGNHHRRYAAGDEGDGFTQVVFLAEALDLIRFRGGTPNLEGLWEAGRLTGPRDSVAEWLTRQS